MTVTILGYLLIPIGIFFLLSRSEYLLPSTVIFIGFSGSAVLLIGDLGIQPSYWFVMLWIISKVIKGIRIEKIKKNAKRNICLFAFVLYATASTILPLILENNIIIMNVDGNITSLEFTASCITQLAYLWFCYISFLLFSVHLNDDQKIIDDFIHYYLIGGVLVCIVCFYQIFCFKTGLPFDELFRQNLHGNVQGVRIYGPCIEASMLCYYLVTILPFCFQRKSWWSLILLIAIIGLGIYSFSSTFIFGLGMWIIFEATYTLRARKMKMSSKKIRMIIIGYILVITSLFVFGDYVEYALEKLLITINQENISGIQRSYSFRLLVNAFIKSPILGIGFGTCRGNDLFSTWLAELGVIGVGLLITYLLGKLFRTKARWNLKAANALVWIVMLVSVPEPYNLFVWLLLSLLDASHNCRNGKPKLYERI